MPNQTVPPRHSRNAPDLRRNQTLVDVLSHEIRTPLTILVGHAECLQDLDLDLPQEVQRSVAAIARAAGRLTVVMEAINRLTDLESAVCQDPV